MATNVLGHERIHHDDVAFDVAFDGGCRRLGTACQRAGSLNMARMKSVLVFCTAVAVRVVLAEFGFTENLAGVLLARRYNNTLRTERSHRLDTRGDRRSQPWRHQGELQGIAPRVLLSHALLSHVLVRRHTPFACWVSRRMQEAQCMRPRL